MEEVILTFQGTHQVIAAEQALLAGEVPVGVMPTPTSISAGCGLCLRLHPGRLTPGRRALFLAGIPVERFFLRGEAAGDCVPLEPGSRFSAALPLPPGSVAAIVGAGGKTSLLNRLAEEHRGGRVLISTTTHFRRPPASVFDREVSGGGVVGPGVNLYYGGEEPGTGKLVGGPPEELRALVPEDGVTLLECDGSRGLPLKGWAEYEPVIPPFATATIGVCTLTALGQPVSGNTVHRPDKFCALTGAEPGQPVETGHIAAMVAAPGGMFAKAAGQRMLFINSVDDPADLAAAREWAAALPTAFRHSLCAVAAGSLKNQFCERIG